MFKMPVEISARHIHLSQNDAKMLFGRDYKFKKRNNISQPGEFACQETVILKVGKGQINNLRIVGPWRAKTQIELSKTDARTLGIDPPLRLSGDLRGSLGGRIIGPKGKIDLLEGIIIAKRHLHLNPKVNKYNLKDKQKVSILVKTRERAVTFHQVIVRISDKYTLSFHLDTDEANAAGIGGKIKGMVEVNHSRK